MAKLHARRYACDVTTSDTPNDFDEVRAQYARDSAAFIRQRDALAKAEEANKQLLVRAMKAGYAEKRAGFRSDLQKLSPFSVPTVRALAEGAGIPPDERYVKAARVRRAREDTIAPTETLAPQPEPRAEASTAPRSPRVPTRDELPYRYRKLAPALVAHIIDLICGENPSWHEEVRALLADFAPEFHDGLEIKRAQDDRILDALDIKLP